MATTCAPHDTREPSAANGDGPAAQEVAQILEQERLV
jgi:hypothetical protein